MRTTTGDDENIDGLVLYHTDDNKDAEESVMVLKEDCL